VPQRHGRTGYQIGHVFTDPATADRIAEGLH
jgi:hypothetical protein